MRTKFISKISVGLVMLGQVLLFNSCGTENKDNTKIEMLTDYGKILIELSNQTPKHRDNFIKLVEEARYDSLLFHRVIDGFMIQSGDPDSKYASSTDTIGSGDLDYQVPAEFTPSLFNKRGALAAARDGNPERASSAMQFYIVQGVVYNDSLLDIAEEKINRWLSLNNEMHKSKNKIWLDSLRNANKKEDYNTYSSVSDTLLKLAKSDKDFEEYKIPQEHKKVYKTIGGAAHLDQNYTVFGEVVEGMHVVDSIAAVQTGKFDRPVDDVRLISARIIK